MIEGDPRSAGSEVVGDGEELRRLFERSEAERQALIRQLEEKNDELKRYTYTVSHDLKSPLITIQGFLGLIERSAREGKLERLRSDMARIDGAVEKMRELLDNLLQLSRVGRMVNPPVHASFSDLAREAAKIVLRSSAEQPVEVEIAPDLPPVYGDRPRLVQVLFHLLENAVKFIGDPDAPRIEIGCRQEAGGPGSGEPGEPGEAASGPQGRTPVFYVRDNGIGVDPRFHEKIFGLFDQLEKSTPGTGIGLTLVKRIVELHDGRVWIESEGEGKGSCFCLTLPAAPAD